MKITITYDRLVQSKDALDAISKIKGLPAADKMLFARTRRHLAGDLQDIEDVRTELAKKYVAVGHKRQIDEVKARADAITDPAEKAKVIAAAEAIAEPTGVLAQEMQAFQIEYTKHLEEKVEVSVPQLILASKIVSAPDILAEHVFALDWMIRDDVTPETELEAEKQDAAAPPATPPELPLAARTSHAASSAEQVPAEPDERVLAAESVLDRNSSVSERGPVV